MPLLKPDPTFYPSPRLAMQAPPEKHAFVAALNPPGSKLNDALLVVDVDPESATYGQRVGEVKLPNFGDELHHFGWNACSSALCPYAPHPHVERRYLVVPGLRSSRIHIIDTKPDPRQPKIVKVIEPEEVMDRAGYSRLHTVHCAPDGLDVGAEQQMVLELRPSHDPTRSYGFVGVVVSLKDLSASVWLWDRAGENWGVRKVIEIPAAPADPDDLPPALKPFKAVPPLVTDIELSLDDKFLYVSCWGTGELRQYDVSNPSRPRLAGSVRLGGIVARSPHEKAGRL